MAYDKAFSAFSAFCFFLGPFSVRCFPGFFQNHAISRTDACLTVSSEFVPVPLVIGGLARGPDLQKEAGQPGVECVERWTGCQQTAGLSVIWAC